MAKCATPATTVRQRTPGDRGSRASRLGCPERWCGARGKLGKGEIEVGRSSALGFKETIELKPSAKAEAEAKTDERLKALRLGPGTKFRIFVDAGRHVVDISHSRRMQGSPPYDEVLALVEGEILPVAGARDIQPHSGWE